MAHHIDSELGYCAITGVYPAHIPDTHRANLFAHAANKDIGFQALF